jgi:superkiller protein 3
MYPNNEEVLVSMGKIYIDIGDKIKAQELLNRAIKIDATDGDGWYNLGIVYDKFGNYEKAVSCFENASRYNYNIDESEVETGLAYSNIGNFSKADEAFNKAIKYNPNNDRAWLEIGYLWVTKDTVKATTYYEKTLEINPKNAYAWVNLGNIDLGKRDTANALCKLRKYVTLESKNVLVWFELGIIAMAQRKFILAQDAFENVLKLNPNNDTARIYLTSIYFNSKNLSATIANLKYLIDQKPNCCYAYYFLATLYSTKRDRWNTFQFLKKAISINNKVKIDVKSNGAFGWLLEDKEFIEITTLLPGEKLSDGNLEFPFQMVRHKKNNNIS